MKRFYLFTFLLFVSGIFAIAQSIDSAKDVTRFLGLPVDGTEKEMTRALIEKGFEANKIGDSNFLTGRFNDENVMIWIHSNNNKIYRVVVTDEVSRNKHQIKRRFNELCYQFEHNPNYIVAADQRIPAAEDIAYEKSRGKDYQAYFFQEPDEEILYQLAKERVHETYTEEQIQAILKEGSKEKLTDIYAAVKREILSNKVVYISIIGRGDEDDYRIAIYYENGYNASNGRDL